MHSRHILTPLFSLVTLTVLGLAVAPCAQAQQTLYVANQGTGDILQFPPQGGASVFAGNSKATGSLSNPNGLVFGSDGSLYTADTNNFRIVKFSAAGLETVVSDSTQGENSPLGLAFDSAGTLYAANNNTSRVVKVAPGGTATQFGPSFSFPTGLAFSSGNLYVGSQAGPDIEVITPGGSGSVFANTNTGSGVSAGLAFDSAGNLYVAKSTNTIVKITPGGVTSVFSASFVSGDLNDPRGLAFDGAGNLYVANHGDNTIEMFNSAGVGSLFANSSGLSLPTFLTFGPVAAPEPSQFVGLGLGALGLCGLVLQARRRKAVCV